MAYFNGYVFPILKSFLRYMLQRTYKLLFDIRDETVSVEILKVKPTSNWEIHLSTSRVDTAIYLVHSWGAKLSFIRFKKLPLEPQRQGPAFPRSDISR